MNEKGVLKFLKDLDETRKQLKAFYKKEEEEERAKETASQDSNNNWYETIDMIHRNKTISFHSIFYYRLINLNKVFFTVEFTTSR